MKRIVKSNVLDQRGNAPPKYISGSNPCIYLIMRYCRVFSRLLNLGGWEGKMWMSDDFDAPLGDFKEYIE
jgi:hypothetical protein